MNVKEIVPGTRGTIPHYIESTIGLTALTVWIVVAFQSRYLFNKDMPFWQRLGWPLYLIYYMIQRARYPDRYKSDARDGGAAPMFDFGVLR